MPRFSMPESSTAIFAATTEPAPARSVYRLDMSDSTPILITLFEICACAAPAANVPAIASASRLRFIRFIQLLLEIDNDGNNACTNLDAEILVQLRHFRIKLGIGNHVDDSSMLHDVMAIRDRGREAEILLDQQDRESLRLQAADRATDLLDDDGREALG